MAADLKHELHTLIDQLGDDAAAETLAFARQLLQAQSTHIHSPTHVPARPHAVPTIHRAMPITTIDALRAALFEAEESAVAFDDTIRRWREEPESGRDE